MDVYLSLGSNLGNRLKILREAVALITDHPQISFSALSNFAETEPYGFQRQPSFINCTMRVETNLQADELLAFLQDIEKRLGRERGIKWGPRTLDIDILFYGDKIVEQEDLLIPHPGIRSRPYLLHLLQELCPEKIHPLLGRTVRELYRILQD